MNGEKRPIPGPVVRRLPRYLAYIMEYRRDKGDDVRYIYSCEIARALGLTTSTVRQDFTHLDFTGINKLGYDLEQVEEVLVEVLGVGDDRRLVIVGAGNLGRALASHGNFGRYAFHIIGIFDNAPHVIGDRAGKFEVQGMEKLADFIQAEKVDIGVIAVPSESAQNVADRLIMAGVSGILNLSFVRVVAPPRVPVVDGRIVASLLELSCLMGMDPVASPE